MALNIVTLGYEYFPDPTVGRPVFNGSIYVGEPNTDPEILGNQKPVTLIEEDGTQVPVAQPLVTGAGGVVLYNGSPVKITVDGNYSLKVLNSSGSQVYYLSDAFNGTPLLSDSENIAVLFNNVSDMQNGLLPDGSNASLSSGQIAKTKTRAGTAGGGEYDVVLTSSVTPNTYNIIQSTAQPSLSFVLREGARLDMSAWGASSGVDNGLIMQSAWDQYPEAEQIWPAGTFPIQTGVNLLSGTGSTFNQGPRITGSGIGSTIFDNQVSSDAMLDVDSGGVAGSNFLMGATLKGFKVIRTTVESGQIAIRFKTSYMVEVDRVHIDGMTGTGINIPCLVGDNDGSNMLKLRQVRIENCSGWGIDAAGASGFNEFSFMGMEHVFIQNCGVDNAAYQPPSGGMSWKGQIIKMDNCAFTLNKNCAFWIPGDAGAAQTVDIQDTTFENNEKRNIFCRGISQFKARNIQQYHNNSFIGVDGIEFEGGTFVIRNVDIDGCVVRATIDNNTFTAFKISGANTDLNSCRVKNVVWDNFDYAGQTRFNGWQFDKVENDLILEVSNSTTLTLKPRAADPKGNKIPLRLRGGIGGTPSTTGEWIQREIQSGITIDNSGLLAGTRYYCYLYDNNGVAALELDAVAFTRDTSTGYPVKSGDATRYYVGSVITDGSSLFVTSGTGWLNPAVSYDGPQGGVPVYSWFDTTTTRRVKYAAAPISNVDGTLL